MPHATHLSILTATLILAACQATPPAGPATTAPAANTPIPPAVATLLPELAKGHRDKAQFAWYATNPLFRKMDPSVKAFADTMEADHKRLLNRLEAIARQQNISLQYQYPPALEGQALRIMEKSQEKLVRSASADEFQRLYLLLSWTDLYWHLSLIEAALTQTPPGPLHDYLQDSLALHRQQAQTLRELLGRYGYTP